MAQAVLKKAAPGDVAALGRLSDRVFRAGQEPGTAMPVEFAPMFSADNARHLYFAEDGGEPVSLVGMMPGAVHINGVRVTTASMGSVCTLEAYRRQHLVSRMIEQVIADFTPDASVLLVSGGLSIYRRVGCVDFGEWLSVLLEGPVADSPVCRVEEWREPAGHPALFALYSTECCRFHRTPAGMAELLGTLRAPRFRDGKVPPRLLVARQHGEIVGYAVALLHRHWGGDTAHLLEWAGARSALPHLADAARRSFGAERAHFYAAPADAELCALLPELPATLSHANNEGTIRVLNPLRLLREIGPLIEQAFGARLELPQTGEEEWYVHWEPVAGNPLPAGEGNRLSGYAELTSWFFEREGMNLPFPRADDLNYI